ncbi:MAG: hypothetical protein Q8P18_26520 [Pseudomonadota bacterium]|nr:hypothetical protein [Pseudomonadota bacterium]
MTLLVALMSLALASGGPGTPQGPAGNPGAPPAPAGNPGAAQGPAGNPGAAPAPAGNPGDQRVTVYFRGVPSGSRVQAQRGGEAPTAMVDAGIGALVVELFAPPARFLQLRLVQQDERGAPYPVYDGLVVLSDPAHETIAFQYQDRQALRLPVSPSAGTEVSLDQRTTWWVSFGWGALSLSWLGLLGVMWALRSR